MSNDHVERQTALANSIEALLKPLRAQHAEFIAPDASEEAGQGILAQAFNSGNFCAVSKFSKSKRGMSL